MSDGNERSTAEDGWTILRSGGHDTTGIEIPTKPTGVSCANGLIRLALGRNGEARLLLPLGASESPKGVLGAPALNVAVSTYTDAGRPRRFLDLTCMSAELETVFAKVADQILARVETGSACVDAVRSTIEEFRALLIRLPSSDVAETKIAGLVGELLVLKRLLDRSSDAWKSWRGPAGDRHDFAMSSVSLEVKVTVRKGKSAVSINGIEQLSEPAGGRLFLQHFEMEAAASGMLSVSSLGRAVLAAASQPERVKELLSTVGCTDVDDGTWNGTSFRLENETLYKVEPGFPRLVPSSFLGGIVPRGVSDVTYVAELADAAEFRVEPSQTYEVERSLLP